MFRILTVLVLAVALASVTGCAQTEARGAVNHHYDFNQINKVAVVGITGALVSEAAKQQITDVVNAHLLRNGYSPVERQQVRAIMQERDFQGSSVTQAAQLGRMLNVQAGIIINVPKYREEMSMSMKMVDVSDASILWTASGTASTGGGLSKLTGALTGAAAGAAAANSADESGTIGGAAGAVAGAGAGEYLTPQKEEQMDKLVTKLFETLPAR